MGSKELMILASLSSIIITEQSSYDVHHGIHIEQNIAVYKLLYDHRFSITHATIYVRQYNGHHYNSNCRMYSSNLT